MDSTVALQLAGTGFWQGSGTRRVQCRQVTCLGLTSSRVKGTLREGFGVAVPTLLEAACITQNTGSKRKQLGLLSPALSWAVGRDMCPSVPCRSRAGPRFWLWPAFGWAQWQSPVPPAAAGCRRAVCSAAFRRHTIARQPGEPSLPLLR